MKDKHERRKQYWHSISTNNKEFKASDLKETEYKMLDKHKQEKDYLTNYQTQFERNKELRRERDNLRLLDA